MGAYTHWGSWLIWMQVMCGLGAGLACFIMPFGFVTIIRHWPGEMAAELARREAAEAAKARTGETEERLHILLQCRLGEALDLLDCEGNIETWNSAAVRLKGYDLADVIGRNISMFFTPEDIADRLPARLLARARNDGVCVAEHWCVRKDGSRFLARRSLEAIHRPDGGLRGFANVTCDITDQRIEDEQRAIIIDAAPNGMMIVNESGIVTLANEQCGQIFGYRPGAMAGQPVDSFLPHGFCERHVALQTRPPGSDHVVGSAAGFVLTGRKRNGGDVPIEIMLTPVKTPRGRIVIASIVDTTERQLVEAERIAAELRERRAVEETNARLDRLTQDLAQARDRAERANQAKSRFLASVTHELRTPLHGILGYAELMSIEGGLTQTQSDRLDVMVAAGHHLLGMVNSVLDMSQIEADRLELHPARTELRALVSVCLDVVRPAADAKGLLLRQAPSEPIHVLVDATRLRQILINLLGNAVKFTQAGAVEARLAQTACGEWFRLEVADTGPGVRHIHLDKLFQTFERLNAEAVSGAEGTGLGLAFAARLVELMGGRIGYADNPGGGSLFWLELPARCDAAAPEAGEAAPAMLPPAPRLRVLVADDEALNRSIVQEFLRGAGHEVVCVHDGAAAVAAAGAADFDAVLMDVRMPGMNGLEATRLIRALPAPRGQVFVIAVTAQAFSQQIETCLKAGMDSHLSKPFTRDRLVAALAGATKAARGTTDSAASDDPSRDAAEPAAALFDRATFQDVVHYLLPVELARHLHAMATTATALQRHLRALDTPDGAAELAADAHRLAGSAGLLGFASISAACLAFERAADTDSTATSVLAVDLANVIDAAMPIIERERERLTETPALSKS